MAFQRSSLGANQTVVNSPARIGKFLVDAPLHGDRFSLSGGFQYLSERATLGGSSVPPVYLVNLAVASRSWLPGGMEFQAGIHNLFNRRYWDPGGSGEPMDSIQQDGRSFFVRVLWAAPRERPARSGPPASRDIGTGKP